MADQTIWGVLGEIQFQAQDTPESLKFKQSVRFADLSRTEGKSLLQWLGADLTTATMAFSFDAGWCNPDEKLEQLQQAMADHEPMFLGLGAGRFKGYYLIEALSTVVKQTLTTGEAIALQVSVTLTETTEKPQAKTELKKSPFVKAR